ncbi:hypothetical protein SAMN05216604_114121 [Pseudomonas agarici]|nr:hypothetical protein SAMN05216604_114121 [Pseudomonas agarici]
MIAQPGTIGYMTVITALHVKDGWHFANLSPHSGSIKAGAGNLSIEQDTRG